jgi:hypothetical protein
MFLATAAVLFTLAAPPAAPAVRSDCATKTAVFGQEVVSVLREGHSVEAAKRAVVSSDAAFKLMGEALVDAVAAGNAKEAGEIFDMIIDACVQRMSRPLIRKI